MKNAFIEKLRRFNLPAEDFALLTDVVHRTSHIAAHQDLFDREASADHLHILLEGCACKYRSMPSGGRQIVYVYLPGDVCDLEWLTYQQRISNVVAMTDCSIAVVPAEWLTRMISERPAIREMFRSLMVAEALALTERIVSLCGTSAKQKVAYLLYDLVRRLEALGQSPLSMLHLGLTQTEIAVTVGLSYIHVNRLLQNLREEGVITYKGRTYKVLDRAKLQDYALSGGKPARTPVAVAD